MKTLNNTIQEIYCSFEVSKLLKEKGFAVPTLYHYGRVNDHISIGSDIPVTNWNKKHRDKIKEVELFSRPTHALAIEWIRVNFDIHVFGNMFSITTRKYSWEIWNHTTEKHYSENNDSEQWRFSSPQEATEAALLYVLNNLI